MLSTEEIAEMRQTAESTLGSICNVITVERSRDDQGNVEEATVTGPDFACHAAQVFPQTETEIGAARVAVLNSYRVLFPVTVDLNTTDRLIVDVEGAVLEMEVIGGDEVTTYRPLRSAIATLVP